MAYIQLWDRLFYLVMDLIFGLYQKRSVTRVQDQPVGWAMCAPAQGAQHNTPKLTVQLAFLFNFTASVSIFITNFFLRILLTLHASVACGEGSFSKMKLIKSYLRSTTGNNRLSLQAILSKLLRMMWLAK